MADCQSGKPVKATGFTALQNGAATRTYRSRHVENKDKLHERLNLHVMFAANLAVRRTGIMVLQPAAIRRKIAYNRDYVAMPKICDSFCY